MKLTVELFEQIRAALKSDGLGDSDMRLEPRVGMAGEAKMLCIAADGACCMSDVRVRDVSRGGLGLLYNRRMAKRQSFILQLSSRTGDAICLLCNVCHCRQIDDAQFLIGAYVDRQLDNEQVQRIEQGILPQRNSRTGRRLQARWTAERGIIPIMKEDPQEVPLDLAVRPRRLRQQPQLRRMLHRVALRRSDIIVPLFVTEGAAVRKEVPSMPGVYQLSLDLAVPWLAQRAAEGFGAYLVFGVIDRKKKDDLGNEALNEQNIVCQLLRRVNEQKIPMAGITDLCFCQYTSHGHCGPHSGDQSTVKNDSTVHRLVHQAVNHARAGAAVIAPSGMMDGMIGALRGGLDAAGFTDVALLSYAVKYASAFYGPFRDAADSAPAFGDRHSYQMDPARGLDEALHEVELDVRQGADMVMVKPAGPYLDVIAAVRAVVRLPVVAYQVSGEYAMIEAAAAKGWIDGDRTILESLLSIKRAGADLIISYYAERLAKLLPA